MSDKTPGARDGFELPGTERVRADELRVQDRVFVRHDDEDIWALITAINPAEEPGTLLLKLQLEVDQAPIKTCTHTAPLARTYLRMLPFRDPADLIRRTTEHGLAAAGGVYRTDWDTDGVVSVHLPMQVACQMLGDRGWHHVRCRDGSHFGWTAPTGERFWDTDEAVRAALTAECVDSTTPTRLDRPAAN